VRWLVVNDSRQDVRNVVLADIFFIDSQHVRRRRPIGLRRFVKCVAIEVAQIAGLTYPQDDGFQESIETPQQRPGRDFGKVPGPDGLLDWFKDRILADAGQAAQNDSVIDLLLWALDSVRQKVDQVLIAIGVGTADVTEPWSCFLRITAPDGWRAIQIKRAAALTIGCKPG
jgi:hypothetical protein